jgi:Zn-dependent M28 family amino/carboxypeptidase
MEGNKIPAIAISTNDAEKLSKVLKSNPQLKVNIQVDAEDITTQSYNLIADLKGSEKPDEFIIVAGHLDAWHNTEGAHDDGVGCLQSTEVLRLFKQLGLNNKRSIRVILYMDEELYQSGGNAYVSYSKEQQVMNYFAIESDAGGFSPRFFSVDAPDIVLEKIKKYESFLKPYGIEEITAGGSGVDIGPMKELGVPLSGYRTDWQRYFDMHHSANDTFDQVHFREMQLGSGAMASLVYLIDKYDLANQN